MTLTLAALYERQGLFGKAREIYRRLAAEGNEAAKRRLDELPSAEPRIAALRDLLQRIERAGRRKG